MYKWHGVLMFGINKVNISKSKNKFICFNYKNS